MKRFQWSDKMADKKISLDGAVMRSKLRGALVHQIAKMKLTTEAEGLNLENDLAMDGLIRRAREINATAAKGEIL
jgi:hypothetical protein